MSFSGGNFIQGNAISETLKNSYNIDPYLTAGVLTALVGAVIFFGLKGIATVCGKLVPLMAFIYVLGCLVLLCINFEYIGEAIILIFKSAFEPQAIGGGAVGGLMVSLQYGVSRGLLSNESGMGSAPIIAAAAKTRNPVRQALVSSTSTFWDTLVVCTITGIVTVSAMLALGISSSDESSGLIMQDAFRQIPVVGHHLLTVAMFTFAFSTTLGWTYYGERAVEYLIGHRKRRAIHIFRTCWVLSTFIGAIMPLELVWNIGSTAAIFMAVPNLLSLIMLTGLIVKETKYYLWEDRLDETSDEEIPSL
jgi:AGCS family alanine or glycine:cation symporter